MPALSKKWNFWNSFVRLEEKGKKKKILLDLSAKQITHMAKIMNDV